MNGAADRRNAEGDPTIERLGSELEKKRSKALSGAQPPLRPVRIKRNVIGFVTPGKERIAAFDYAGKALGTYRTGKEAREQVFLAHHGQWFLPGFDVQEETR